MSNLLRDLGVSPPQARRRPIRWVAIGGAILTGVVVGLLLISNWPQQITITHHRVFYTESDNWAGFAVVGTAGSVTAATATWVQPSYMGACNSSVSTAAVFWTGIDGVVNESLQTVEQVGTLLDCDDGIISSLAWYEYFPAPAVNITAFQITPGDTVDASVSYSGGSFALQLEDVTQHAQFQNDSTGVRAERLSAEWIAETPYAGRPTLTDFGSLHFLECSAVLNGRSGIPDEFAGIEGFNMTNINGSAERATISPLNQTTGGFTVSWETGAP